MSQPTYLPTYLPTYQVDKPTSYSPILILNQPTTLHDYRSWLGAGGVYCADAAMS